MTMPYRSINPATEAVIYEKNETAPADAIRMIEKTHAAFHEWRRTAISERASLVLRLSELTLERKQQLGELMATEMGKPILQGIAEAEKCAWLCRHYAETAESLLSDEIVQTDASKSYIAYRPVGIVLGIMPWNFPFWQVYRFIVPALMAGNGTILKHSPNVSFCAETILNLVKDAGFPSSIFDVVFVQPDTIAKMIEHPFIQGVTLTGSTRAGKTVASKAGMEMKKTVMELGGSDPYIVLEDADLPLAAEACVTGRLINAGQSCIAAKRFIVVEKIRKTFEELVIDLMRSKKTGDPMNPENYIGPIARHDLRETLHDQVVRSIRQGASCVLGGKMPEGKGFFYPPTVLTGVSKGMAAYEEETFGPVASIITVKNEKEAVDVANDTAYGLGGAVFSKDILRAERIARDELFAGNCFVNAFVKSDPRLPFGGMKLSGYGRELSPYGIREFTNIKTVFIK